MFGIFFNLLSVIQSVKTKKIEQMKNKVKKLRQKNSLSKNLDILKSKKAMELDEDVQKGIKLAKKEKAKLLLLRILTAIISFIETIFMWIIATIGIMAFFIILFSVVVIIIVMSLINALDFDLDSKNNMIDIPDGLNIGGYKTELTWSEYELAAYDTYYNNKEKNLFRLAMLYSNLLKGDYDGYKFMKTDYEMGIREKIAYFMGFSATESSMEFYDDRNLRETGNILVTPSDMIANSKGYALFGLHKDGDLYNYGSTSLGIPEGVINAIKNKWKYASEPIYEGNYAPYGTAIQVQFLSESKLSMVESQIANVNKYIDEATQHYGIKENKKILTNYILYFLASAQYHGASYSEYQSYISFLCALWSSTSSIDADRGFNKLKLSDNVMSYDESSARKYVLSYHFGLDGEPQEINLDRVFTTPRFKLDGVGITKSLFGYAYENCGDKEYFEETVVSGHNEILNYETSGGRARVLNYHYGLLAYIVGNTILDRLESAVPLVKALVKTTEGVVQGPWKDEGLLNALNNSKYKENFGVAYGIENKDKKMLVDTDITFEKWRQGSKWKVPFYRQGSGAKEGKAVYGRIILNNNGCHIYMNAYIASALTGTVINPTEMLEAMIYSGSVMTSSEATKGWYNGSKADKVYDYLGIYFIRGQMNINDVDINNSNDLPYFEELWGIKGNPSSKEDWKTRVDKTLENNGIIGLSMGSTKSDKGYSFTTDENHYIVVTEKIGDNYKTMGYGTNGYARELAVYSWDELYNISIKKTDKGGYGGQIYFAHNPNIANLLSNSN